MKYRRKNGNVFTDSMILIFVLFFLALSSIIVFIVFDDLNTDIQNDDILKEENKEIVGDLHSRFPSTFDNIWVLAFGLLWLFVLVASMFVDAHPVFFIISALLLIFVIFIGAVFSNTYEEFTSDPDVQSFADGFPMTNFIMGELPIVALLVGFSIALVLFGKSQIG